MFKKETEAQSDLKGEIQIRQALKRRSLAVDLTGLIEFHVQERWHEKMFESLSKQAPSGYRQTSMEQCREADKMLWAMLAERTRGNVKVTATGKPVQDEFVALSASTEVLLLLQPLPAPSSRPGPMTIRQSPTRKERAKVTKEGATKARARVESLCLNIAQQRRRTENQYVSISLMVGVRELKQANVVSEATMFVSDAMQTNLITSAPMTTDKWKHIESGCIKKLIVARPRKLSEGRVAEVSQFDNNDNQMRGTGNNVDNQSQLHDVSRTIESDDHGTEQGLAFIEICAGSAKLSAAARERGIRSVAVDHQANKHTTHHAISFYDLTSPKAQTNLMEALEGDIPGAIHVAPPCRTCSRAREKPFPGLGDLAPKPLRDERYPFGYPWLTGTERARVLQSNLLYAFVVQLLFFPFTYNVIISVENPANSWLWMILKELVVALGNRQFQRWYQHLEAVQFSNCAFGGATGPRTLDGYQLQMSIQNLPNLAQVIASTSLIQ